MTAIVVGNIPDIAINLLYEAYKHTCFVTFQFKDLFYNITVKVYPSATEERIMDGLYCLPLGNLTLDYAINVDCTN